MGLRRALCGCYRGGGWWRLQISPGSILSHRYYWRGGGNVGRFADLWWRCCHVGQRLVAGTATKVVAVQVHYIVGCSHGGGGNSSSSSNSWLNTVTSTTAPPEVWLHGICCVVGLPPPLKIIVVVLGFPFPRGMHGCVFRDAGPCLCCVTM